MRKLLLLLSVLILFAGDAFSQQKDITGIWKMELNYMGSILETFYKIDKGADGNGYDSYMYVPKQGLKHLKMDSTIFEKLSIRIVSNQLGMTFKGVYALDTFMGEFVQNGIKIPVTAYRAELPVADRPQTPKAPFPYKEEQVRFASKGDIMMAGTLTIPHGSGPFPAVVLVSGSGAQDRNEELFDHKTFMVIADYLTRNGIAVLRYDDRGVGESGGTFAGCTTEDFSNDAQAAVDYLKSRAEFGSVGLCGHSEGGTIAFIVAARSRDVGFVISLAGSSLLGADLLASQSNALGKAMGAPVGYLHKYSEQIKGLYNIVINSSENNSQLRDSIMHYYNANFKGQMSDSQMEAATEQLLEPWMYYFIKYDPFEDISKVNVPILALNGTNDLQVVATDNLPRILKAADTGGNKMVTVKYLNGLNHLFQHSTTGLPAEYGTIIETFSPEVLEIMSTWINNL